MHLPTDSFDKLKHLLHSPLLVKARKYLAFNLISGAIPFLLLPVLTRYLSPEDFGTVALYTALSTVVSGLFALGVNGAVSRLYFDLDEEKFAAFIGTSLCLVTLCAGILSVAIFNAGELIANIIHFPARWLWAVTFTAFSQAVLSVGLAVFQVRSDVYRFGVAQIAQATLLTVLTLILVVGLSFDWRGRIIAQVLSTSIVAIGSVYYLVRRLGVPLRVEANYVRQALRYGLPLVGHIIGGVVISMADRFIIAKLSGLQETGLYAAAGQVTAVLVALIDSFNRAYSPWLFSVLKAGDLEMRRKVVKGFYLYFLVIFVVAMTFAVGATQLLGLLLGEKYAASAQYIYWMAFATALMGMYYMVTLYIQFAKRTEYLAAITIVVGVGNVISCYIFVRQWGGIGAAYAAALSQCGMFVVSWITAARLVPMPWACIGWGRRDSR